VYEVVGRRSTTMRECKDCRRELSEEEFSTGSNWMQCKKCKASQVLQRSYARKGDYDSAVAWEKDGRHYWFQDFIKERAATQATLAKRERERRAEQERRRRDQRKADAEYCKAREGSWGSIEWDLLGECAEEQDRGGRALASIAKDNAKRREQRRLNPEHERALQRAYRERNPERVKALQNARLTAHRTGRPEKALPLNIIWVEHDGLCNICGEPCDPQWWHLDHVVPLSKGGAHSVANCAPAHPYCNLVKGNRENDTLNVEWLRVTRPDWEATTGARMRAGQKSPCGTATRYHKGCRCDECRSAKREYDRDLRAQKAAQDPHRGRRTQRPREHYPHPSECEYFRLRREVGLNVSSACRESGLPLRRAKMFIGV
jgi:5-methylcytosine-specific restriction endonuclease McrA